MNVMKAATATDTVNDRLSALSAYFKTKAFGWAIIRTGRLIRPGRKKNKISR